MSTLDCISVSKSYSQNRVLDDVSATIQTGELVTLLGPSGCGKTTLLRAIAGLAMADSGTIMLNGKDITATPIHRRKIGMVFQSHALFPHMSVPTMSDLACECRACRLLSAPAKSIRPFPS